MVPKLKGKHCRVIKFFTFLGWSRMNLFGDPQELRHGEQFLEPNLDPENRKTEKYIYKIFKKLSLS